jgi:type II secretory pathway component GspD/PulD (secretin)
MNETKPKIRWFKFSIRELLLITAIVALAVGWWLDHHELTKQNLSVLTVYSLSNIDAKVASTTLEKLYSGSPEVRIAADTQQNTIISSAPPRQQHEIKAILLKLDESKPTK